MPPENIPADLRALPRWMPNYGPKHPIDKWATPAERAENCRLLDDLLTSYAKGGKSWKNGYTFFVEKEDRFVCIDIDDCVVDGQIIPEIKALFREVGATYYEVSASGKGVHLVYRGSLPEDFKHTKPKELPDDKFCFPWDVEIFAGNQPLGKGRPFSFTGDCRDAAPLAICEGKLVELLAKCKAALPQSEASAELETNLLFQCAADVQPEKVEWLWPDKIPLSHITLFAGNMDVGKSLACCDITARVSNFGMWPGNVPMPEGVGGEVLIMAEEDNLNQVMVPRLMAAGANLKNIFFLSKVEIKQGAKRKERLFAMNEDMERLDEELKNNPLCQLIIIDPISDYFGKGNMNDKQDARAILNMLGDLCQKYRITIIVIEHFNKRSDASAIHKTGGSVAITAKPRAAFMFAKVPDEDGQYVMHFIKGNLSKKKTGLRYSIADKPIGDLGRIPYTAWGAADAGTADDVLAAEKSRSDEKRAVKAARWLEKNLTEEWKESETIITQAAAEGVSRNALFEARSEGLYSFDTHKRGSAWFWRKIATPKEAADATAPF